MIRSTRLRAPAACLAAAILVTACGTSPTPPSPTPTPAAPTASPAPPTPMSSAAQAAIYASIERDVEGLRGLAPTRPVNPVLLDDAGLRAELAAHADEDAPPAEVAREERLLKALGVLAPDADLAAISRAFLTGQVAGFYRPTDGHLYVVSRSGAIGGIERTTFAHEYTHALQDQHFPLLQELDGPRSGPANDDAGLARLALIEGDATLVMTLWARDHLSPLDLLDLLRSSFDPAQQAALDAMPPFLRDQALFPYEAGLQFTLNRQFGGGWGAIDAVYATPPASTEQVLHPERYAANEEPIAVTLPASLAGRLGSGWTLDSENTLGELQIRAWLAATAPSPTAAAAAPAAAAGWGGDRVALFRGPDDAWALVLHTIWDTDRDALEFTNAATAVVGAGGRHGSVTDGVSPLERWVVLASSDAIATTALRAATGP